MNWIVIFALLAALEQCLAANILYLIPTPTKSHYNLADTLLRELVRKGHHVTLVAPYSMSKPPNNLTEIVVPDLINKFETLFTSKSTNEGKFGVRNIGILAFQLHVRMGKMMFESVMESKQVQNLMKKDQNFDLVIGECILIEGLIAGFSQKYKVPVVGVATFLPSIWANAMIGNPAPAAYVPVPILPYTHKMSFVERCINLVYGALEHFFHYFVHLPTQDELMRKYFSGNWPPLRDIIKNTSLVLVNHHYSLAFPRAYLPNMVEVGSFHIKPPQPLPEDIETFMDEAQDGVILFSMGSALASSDFPEEKVQGILKAFSKLKQRVLWKFEKENLPNLPRNVKISKWLPQSDVLAHSNLRLFITHGGLLSITEAFYRGVPLVAIPIFGDQPINVNFVVDFEVGVKLDYDQIREESLTKAINEVLLNPKYVKNMKHRSKLLRDVPISQLQNAIYWIEYIIRHKGAPHLRSAVQDLSWYQLYLLDVLAFLGLVLCLSFFVVWKFLKCCGAFFCKKASQSRHADKKKN